jgi:Tol biopolymer transport system component
VRRHAVLAATAATLVLASTAGAQATGDLTTRVSVGPGSINPNGPSGSPALAADGAFAAFDSAASNLVADDPNGATRDVFTRDLGSGATTLVSKGGNGPSFEPSVAADSHAVAFSSDASNLVPGDTNGKRDVFVRDTSGLLERVSVTATGGEADGDSSQPDISADGRYVVFSSTATNLVPGDTDGVADVYVRDRATHSTLRISVGRAKQQPDGDSLKPAISADGKTVSFTSAADNLVDGDHNQLNDVFVRNLAGHRTERVTVADDGREQNASVNPSFTQVSDLSADGKTVVFDSDATNLVPGDTNDDTDVFVRDLVHDKTTLASLNSAGEEGDNDSFFPSISGDGRFVAFESFASNLAAGDAPREDIFERDLDNGTTTVVNVPNGGGQRDPEVAQQLLQRPAIDGGGGTVGFVSGADNLVAGDSNGAEDVFIRRPQSATSALQASKAKVSGARATVTVSADDPNAGPLLCAVDNDIRRICFPGAFRTPRLKPGKHVVRVFAGAPGYWFADTPVESQFTIRGKHA